MNKSILKERGTRIRVGSWSTKLKAR